MVGQLSIPPSRSSRRWSTRRKPGEVHPFPPVKPQVPHRERRARPGRRKSTWVHDPTSPRQGAGGGGCGRGAALPTTRPICTCAFPNGGLNSFAPAGLPTSYRERRLIGRALAMVAVFDVTWSWSVSSSVWPRRTAAIGLHRQRAVLCGGGGARYAAGRAGAGDSIASRRGRPRAPMLARG